MKKILSISLLIFTLSSCALLNQTTRNQKKLQKIRLQSPHLFEETTDTIYQIDTLNLLLFTPEKTADTTLEWKNGEGTWEWNTNPTPDHPDTYDWTDFQWLIDDTTELRDETGKLEATLQVKLNKNRLRTDLKVIHHRDTITQIVHDTITTIKIKEEIKTGTINKVPWYLYAILGAMAIIILVLLLRKKKK